MIEWIILGTTAGIIAGLIPGLHSNNITILLAASPFFGTEIMLFVLSMCITQSFVEFIPSTFLGSPDENTFEATLPAHRMVKKGKALEAITLTVAGGLTAVIIGAIITPAFFLLIEQNNEQIVNYTPIVLGFALILFIMHEKNWKRKLLIIFVMIAATTQGIMFQNQLFPLITGYFGLAGILHTLKEKPIQIKQKNEATIKTKTILHAMPGIIGGAIVSVMPGIGSNTAAGIINTFKKTKGTKKYLTMIGAINASNFFFSYATLIAIQKTRNGAMLALQDKIFYTQETLLIGTITMIIAAGIGGLATIILAKKALKIINEKNTYKLNIASIIIIIALVAAFNGTTGIITLIFSTALGLFVIKNNIKRSTCMTALIAPTMLYYLFILL